MKTAAYILVLCSAFTSGYLIGADHDAVVTRISPRQQCVTPGAIKQIYMKYGRTSREAKRSS